MPGTQPYLTRGVYLNRETGGFSVYILEDQQHSTTLDRGTTKVRAHSKLGGERATTPIGGVEQLTDPHVFRLSPFREMGQAPWVIRRFFGGEELQDVPGEM